MIIRNYQQHDLESCRSLWAEMVQQHRKIYDDESIGGDNPGLEFDAHLEQVAAENIWLAESEGEVIGLVSLIVKEQEAEIEPIVVAQEHRGKGVGERLIKHVVEESKKQNILCLSVKPVARNKDAISFFHDCGFRNMGHVQLFTWLDESTENMWKEGINLFGKTFKY